MTLRNEGLLDLIRISDTFFPIGSFTVSQAMEQLVADASFTREGLEEVLDCYMDMIWGSFDLPMFHAVLEAAQRRDLDRVIAIDEICHASKVTEEGRKSMMRMGQNLLKVMDFKAGTLGEGYKDRLEAEDTPGMYPVALAVASNELGLGDQGAASLIYVNMIETIASLVRMAEIDYLEAQRLLANGTKNVDLGARGLNDAHQSYMFS